MLDLCENVHPTIDLGYIFVMEKRWGYTDNGICMCIGSDDDFGVCSVRTNQCPLSSQCCITFLYFVSMSAEDVVMSS